MAALRDPYVSLARWYPTDKTFTFSDVMAGDTYTVVVQESDGPEVQIAGVPLCYRGDNIAFDLGEGIVLRCEYNGKTIPCFIENW